MPIDAARRKPDENFLRTNGTHDIKMGDWMWNLFAVAALLVLAWEVNQAGIYPYWKSARLAVSCFLIAFVEATMHEGGHAIAGIRSGAPIDMIRIGTGPRIALFGVGGISRDGIALHAIPVGGRVDFNALPVSIDRRISMYAAGVIPVLVLTTIAWLIIPRSWLWTEIIAIGYGFSALNIVLWTPQKWVEKGVWSDGQAILGLLWTKRQAAARRPLASGRHAVLKSEWQLTSSDAVRSVPNSSRGSLRG